ncbi:MAG TPA: hypothetical protein DHU96_11195 [Actinobacteria bacterium]|nr:hypothetical protein [Actinomycetota bacterium]
MRQAMSEISLANDTGHLYDVAIDGLGGGRPNWGRQEWHGQVLAEPNLAGMPAWVEFTPARAGASGLVAFCRPPRCRWT